MTHNKLFPLKNTKTLVYIALNLRHIHLMRNSLSIDGLHNSKPAVFAHLRIQPLANR